MVTTSRGVSASLRPRPHRTALLGVILVALLVAACGSSQDTAPGGPTPRPGALQVVATTTILADLVREVGGTAVSVESLVPKGGEVHTFSPTPSDVQRVSGARLILANGLGLDDWLTGLADDAGAVAPIIRVAENLPGVTYLGGDQPGMTANPHLWLNVAYAERYVDRIRQALSDVDPGHAAEFQANADAYQATLAALDTEIRDRLAALPAADRVVVSFHDAFPYFAAAYGLTVVGSIVDAPGQDPSAGQLADLVAAIRRSGAKAVFAEAQFSPKLADTIAGETGITVVTDLHTDSLGDPPADTYVGLMRSNVDEVVAALTGS
jgi:manganese/iron transport system substrate-binding protein